MNLIPYSQAPDIQDIRMVPEAPAVFTPGTNQGVHIVIPVEARDVLVAKIAGWFEGCEEVSFIDAGVSDKQGTGYIILEWNEQEINPLFLAILRDEEVVLDYTTYLRQVV